MRLLPIISAIAVSVLIYGFVFERERFMATLAPAPVDTHVEDEASDEVPAAQETTADTVAAAQPNAPVGVVAVRSVARNIDSAVILRGRTEADRQVEVRAETDGRIISDPLRKGSFVEAGEPLCKLDPATRADTLAEAKARLDESRTRVPEAEARLAEAQSSLEEALINNNAASKLSEGGYASETRVAATRAAVSAAKAAVQSAKAGLEASQTGIRSAAAAMAAAENEITRLEILAPFKGLLETDTAELGSLLQSGSVCATVLQLDPIILVGFVPETQVDRVALGADAGAELVSHNPSGGKRLQGKVTFISRSADPQTRTFRVEIEVPNPDLSVRDGQTAEILISSDGTDAHLLPQSALTLNDEGTLGVRIVTAENTADFVPVTLMRDTVNGVWLTGLPTEADVIIIGQEYVISGVPVKASYREVTQ
ncbi:HlyD family efflux transporter periplasmic adaptor subunit [Pseudohalocynthiibacter aestuariivivens]|nr:efflux RND transporter periplasmic adaptor subunit [Pseudohalocynthiibacter aestuariivivens]QIE44954.1 HlyD family efflux transporter periplasmic adaptor subunit [Pseudohalocynthiibacter aestuariivivens]